MAAESRRRRYISNERIVFQDVVGDTKRTGVIMQYDDFIRVPDHIGGHVSVFPWYPSYVIDNNDNRRREIVFRLGVSNHTYLSNFGGGFSPYKGGILAGLQRELRDEVPLWNNYIMEEIRKHSRTPEEGNCLFLAIYQELVDGVKPVYKDGPIPIKVIIFVPVDGDRLHHLGFNPTREIRGILDKTLPAFHRIVDSTPGIGSDGIRVYHTFRKKMRNDPFLKNLLERYFYNNTPATTQLLASELTNDRVAVTLHDNKTKLRFSNISYNNNDVSKNEEKSWEKRKTYGKKVMKWKPGRSRVPIPFHPLSPHNQYNIINTLKRDNNNEKRNATRKSNSYGSKNKSASSFPSLDFSFPSFPSSASASSFPSSASASSFPSSASSKKNPTPSPARSTLINNNNNNNNNNSNMNNNEFFKRISKTHNKSKKNTRRR